MSRIDLSLIGLGASADAETIAKGRRRVVTYLALLAFGLIVGGADNIDWVKGGIEFSQSRRMLSAAEEPVAAIAEGEAADPNPMAEAVRVGSARALQSSLQSRYFHVGLTHVVSELIVYDNDLGGNRLISQWEDRDEYVSWFNAMTTSALCPTTNSTWRRRFCTLSPLNRQAFKSTYGLLVFSGILAAAGWLGMAAIQNGIPQVVGYKFTFPIVGAVLTGAAFFANIAVIVFASANVKSDFCAVFDPDSQYNNLPCGFSNSYGAAVAGVVFAWINVALFWAWMPKTVAAAKYEFSGAAASAFTGAAASGYEGIAAPGDAAAAEPVATSGGYQGISSTSNL